MQFQNNFDLEEFLAYLLPGFLFLGWYILEYKTAIASISQAFPAGTSDFFIVFVLIVLFVTVSVILGHVFSLASRFVWRTLTNRFVGDPEQLVFSSNDGFFSPPLNALIAGRFLQVFGVEMTEVSIRRAVPRLVRSYVFTQSPPAATSRERIVRSRSICSNLVTPLLAIAVLGGLGMSVTARIILVAAALLLLLKQRDLDVRESKEIYLTFVALTEPPQARPTA